MKRCHLYLLALYAIGFQPLAAFSQSSLSSKIDALFVEWDKSHSPGVMVTVLKDGNIFHQRGYGMANLEDGISIKPTTRFNIASMSKQFTVFSILLLAKDGKLSLEDEVQKHIPELHDFGKKITIGHLIHHTSGLREDWSLLTLAGWRTEDVITEPDLMRLFSRQRELNFDPGAEYMYCNTGYMLLGIIVKRVSGKPIREFAEERIFKPLGMRHSVFFDDYRMLIPNRAVSYGPKRGNFEQIHFATNRPGPSNLFTTVEDLALWDQNFYEPRVGDESIIEQMLIRGKLNDGKEISYAGGLQHRTYRGLKILEHGGAIAGYRSTITRIPDHRFTVILLANLSTFNPASSANKIIDLVFADQIKSNPPEKKEPKKDNSGKEKKEELKPMTRTSEQLNEYSGTFYSTELQVLYTVSVRKDRLVVSHRKGEEVLRPTKEDEFTNIAGTNGLFDKLAFSRNDKKEIVSFAVSTPRARNVRFTKAEIKLTQ